MAENYPKIITDQVSVNYSHRMMIMNKLRHYLDRFS